MPSLPRSLRLMGVCAAVGFVLWMGRPAPGKPLHRLGILPPEGCLPDSECYGYYATCWRRWPEQCHNCPPVEIGLPEEALFEEVDPRLDEKFRSELPLEMEDFPDSETLRPIEESFPELRVDPTDPTLPPDEDMPLERPDSENTPGVEIPDPMSANPPLPQPDAVDPMPANPTLAEEDPLRDDGSFDALTGRAEPGNVPLREDVPLAWQPNPRVRIPLRPTVRPTSRNNHYQRRPDVIRRTDPNIDKPVTVSSSRRDHSTPSGRVTRRRPPTAPVVQSAAKGTRVRRPDTPVRRPDQQQRRMVEVHFGTSSRPATASREQIRPHQDLPQRLPSVPYRAQSESRTQPALRPAHSVPRLFRSIRPAVPNASPAISHDDWRRMLANIPVSDDRPATRSGELHRVPAASFVVPMHLLQRPTDNYPISSARERGIRTAR